MKISPKPKDGRAKFTAKFLAGDFSDRLEDEGLDNIKNGTKPVTVGVTIYFRPQVLMASKSLKYKIKVAKTGEAK